MDRKLILNGEVYNGFKEELNKITLWFIYFRKFPLADVEVTRPV